jgi:nitronate monooxygenase
MIRPTDNRTLLRTLGVRIPIIQAPMAGVGTPALAAAVSNAGGLGSLGVGATNAEGARKMIRDTRAHRAAVQRQPVLPPAGPRRCRRRTRVARLARAGVPRAARGAARIARRNLHELRRRRCDARDAARRKPAVVSFHFGLPSDEAIAVLKRAGITLFATATHPDEAAQIAAAGIDAIVAQGIEAGGHRGVFDSTGRDDGLGTFALTRLLVRECAVPVIAAGGIMDGEGIAAVLALGAQAAQLGTAFVACPETSIDDGYRRAIVGDAARRTTFTTAISGRVARGIANRLTALGDDPHAPPTPAYPIAYDAGKALHAAAKANGEFGYGAQWAGQAAPLIRPLPAAELVAVLERETRDAVARLQHALD